MIDCNQKYPIPNVDRVGFLKNFISKVNIQVGDFTYYDDPEGMNDFEHKNVLYHFDFIGDKLIIGNDVWIGNDVTIMPGIKVGDGSIIASKSVVL